MRKNQKNNIACHRCHNRNSDFMGIKSHQHTITRICLYTVRGHVCAIALFSVCDKDNMAYKAKNVHCLFLYRRSFVQPWLTKNSKRLPSDTEASYSSSNMGTPHTKRVTRAQGLKSPLENDCVFMDFYLLSVSHPNVILPIMSITPSIDIRKAACWWLTPTLKA